MYTNCLLGACLALLVGCATVNTPPAQTAYARVEANIPGWARSLMCAEASRSMPGNCSTYWRKPPR